MGEITGIGWVAGAIAWLGIPVSGCTIETVRYVEAPPSKSSQESRACNVAYDVYTMCYVNAIGAPTNYCAKVAELLTKKQVVSTGNRDLDAKVVTTCKLGCIQATRGIEKFSYDKLCTE
jgi:hypothetical protein